MDFTVSQYKYIARIHPAKLQLDECVIILMVDYEILSGPRFF